MRNFMTLVIGCTCLSYSHAKQYIQQDARRDALIVNGTQQCNPSWTATNIKNNSGSQSLSVTIEEETTKGQLKDTKSIVFNRLAPKEEKPLGCRGCGETTSGTECHSFRVVAANYVQ